MQESKASMLRMMSTRPQEILQCWQKRLGTNKNTQGLQAQESILEAYRKVDNLDERTKTKRKNRTVGPCSYEEEQFQDNNTKKGKSEGIRELPDKQAKILKVAEVCVEWSCPTQTGA